MGRRLAERDRRDEDEHDREHDSEHGREYDGEDDSEHGDERDNAWLSLGFGKGVIFLFVRVCGSTGTLCVWRKRPEEGAAVGLCSCFDSWPSAKTVVLIVLDSGYLCGYRY